MPSCVILPMCYLDVKIDTCDVRSSPVDWRGQPTRPLFLTHPVQADADLKATFNLFAGKDKKKVLSGCYWSELIGCGRFPLATLTRSFALGAFAQLRSSCKALLSTQESS